MKDREDAVRVIASLRARARSTPYPAEAEACRRQIERLTRDDGSPAQAPPPQPPERLLDGSIVGCDPWGRPIVVFGGCPLVTVPAPVAVRLGAWDVPIGFNVRFAT